MARTAKPYSLFGLAAVVLLVFAANIHADIVINFSDGDQFDGDTVGDTATFTDAMTGETGILTTTDGHTNMTLNSINFGLGLGPSNSSFFDGPNGEFWVFSWNKSSSFKSLSFANMGSQDIDKVIVQSDDWIGGGFTPGDFNRVSFDNTTGTFTLDRGFGGTTQQTWTLSDLSSGEALDISANTEISFSPGELSSVVMTEMVFSVIPEPTSSGLVILAVAGLAMRRRKKPLA